MRINRRKLNIVLGVVGILLLATWRWGVPWLNRARETGGRITCRHQLAILGKALLLYANEHRGQLPNELTELMGPEAEMGTDAFICPSGHEDRPRGTPTTQQAIDQIHARGLPRSVHDPADPTRHCSYVYRGRGLTWTTPAREGVLAYCLLANHDGDGAYVLFADGRVEFIERKRIDAVVREP